MTPHDDDYERWWAVKVELTNQLVIPALRRFFEEARIPFHVWDELPRSAFDSGIESAETLLMGEAMELFHIVKPEYFLFKDCVVSFQFEDWSGSFSHTMVPVGEFLDHAADNAYFIQELEARMTSRSFLLGKLISRLPRRVLDDGRLANVGPRLKKLRRQLDSIRGARPNPLDAMATSRTQPACIDEFTDVVDEEMLAELRRRLRTHLRPARPAGRQAEG